MTLAKTRIFIEFCRGEEVLRPVLHTVKEKIRKTITQKANRLDRVSREETSKNLSVPDTTVVCHKTNSQKVI